MNFKVGDIITGNDGRNGYGITNSKGTYRVTDLADVYGDISIIVVTHSTRPTTIDNNFVVDPNRFKLVTPAKPKLETLIKRANLGSRAISQILEHYPNEVTCQAYGLPRSIEEIHEQDGKIFMKK